MKTHADTLRAARRFIHEQATRFDNPNAQAIDLDALDAAIDSAENAPALIEVLNLTVTRFEWLARELGNKYGNHGDWIHVSLSEARAELAKAKEGTPENLRA